jgi:hypothetical protein
LLPDQPGCFAALPPLRFIVGSSSRAEISSKEALDMLVHRGTILRTAGPLAALLALAGSLSAADRDCAPQTCCPQPTTKKTTDTVYSETVTDVCFPPTLCMRIKKCLGLAPDCGCDGCAGAPRKVHKLTTRVITEEKCSVKYEPVALCPGAACSGSGTLPAGGLRPPLAGTGSVQGPE